jgi:hypothetical protein
VGCRRNDEEQRGKRENAQRAQREDTLLTANFGLRSRGGFGHLRSDTNQVQTQAIEQIANVGEDHLAGQQLLLGAHVIARPSLRRPQSFGKFERFGERRSSSRRGSIELQERRTESFEQHRGSRRPERLSLSLRHVRVQGGFDLRDRDKG